MLVLAVDGLLKAFDECLDVGVALHGEPDLPFVLDRGGLELREVDETPSSASLRRSSASVAFGLGAEAT